jgi:2-desacetyl-2-hydroxyethyl bacteriochlorophyllide A dehydrogenase
VTALRLPTDGPALVVPAFSEIVLDRRPVTAPEPGELLIATWYSGVSVGTELWAATGKRLAWGEPPYVPGYQAVGEVIAVGDEDGDFAVGDLVVAFSSNSHQRYQIVRTGFSHRVESPDRLALTSMFVQPSVGANALNLAGVSAGDTLVVVGQGLIGQATAMLARLKGATVYASDISPERLELSRRHCADHVFDVSERSLPEQLAEVLPGGADIVVESTGFAQVIEDALRCVRWNGTFVFEGYVPGTLSFEFDLAHTKQIRAVFPTFIGDPPVRESVIRQIQNGTLDLAPLVDDVVPYSRAAESYARLFTEERHHLRGIIIDWRDAA